MSSLLPGGLSGLLTNSVVLAWTLRGEAPIHTLGCFVHDNGTVGDLARKLSIMFFGVPLASTFIVLVCCNCIVAGFVWKTTRSSVASVSSARSKKQPIQVDQGEEVAEETALPRRSERKYKTSDSTLSGSDNDQKMQNRRLRLVCSQAILYVGAFFLSNAWIAIINNRVVFTTTTKQEELNLLTERHGLMVLAAFLHPSQGKYKFDGISRWH